MFKIENFKMNIFTFILIVNIPVVNRVSLNVQSKALAEESICSPGYNYLFL